MDEFFGQIAMASTNGLYFLALAGALMIPDMCAALEAPDGETNGERYQLWYAANAEPLVGPIDANSMWRFRCSLLHQGITSHPKSAYTRLVFTEPGPMTMHLNRMSSGTEEILQLDVARFARAMVDSAVLWQQRVAGTEPYETNLTRFIRRHADGILPFSKGIPTIG